MPNNKSLTVEILLLYNVRKKKKDDSEAVGIVKLFESTERNTLSSKIETNVESWNYLLIHLIIIPGFS